VTFLSPEPQVLQMCGHYQAYAGRRQADLVCVTGLRGLQRAWRPWRAGKSPWPEG